MSTEPTSEEATKQTNNTDVTDRYNVCTVGNAIVDILVKADDTFLESLKLEKNTMTLLEDKKAKDLFSYFDSIRENLQTVSSIEIKEMSGGTAANVVAGICSLGGKTAFIGKINDDVYGQRFVEKLNERGVECATSQNTCNSETGRCLVVVTEDGSRTMCTYLGANNNITVDDINEDVISHSQILLLTGYLWDNPEAKNIVTKTIEIARNHGRKVAFALSDTKCVMRHKEAFIDMVDNHIDFLFSNESELISLCGVNSHEEAVSKIATKFTETDKIAALTCGEKGSIILSKEGTLKTPAVGVDKLIDRTGAGALFVSGFLYGQTNGLDLEKSARLANACASEVIKILGARPQSDLKSLLQNNT